MVVLKNMTKRYKVLNDVIDCMLHLKPVYADNTHQKNEDTTKLVRGHTDMHMIGNWIMFDVLYYCEMSDDYDLTTSI